MPYYEIIHHTSDMTLYSHYYLTIYQQLKRDNPCSLHIHFKQANLYFFDSGNYDIPNYISKPKEINMNFMRNR